MLSFYLWSIGWSTKNETEDLELFLDNTNHANTNQPLLPKEDIKGLFGTCV